jgi:alkylmercury lyase
MTQEDKNRATSPMVNHLTVRWNSLPIKTLIPVFPMLAKGKPVSIEELAAKTDKKVSDIREELVNAPVEWNEREELINVFGFKFAPTSHRLEFEGVITFCCCALWLHFLPLLVGKTATVDSIDPISRRLVRLVMTPSGVDSVQPSSATATLVDTTMESLKTNVGDNFCSHVRLFHNTDSASQWIADDPRRYQVDMRTLDMVAQQMCTDIWFKKD